MTSNRLTQRSAFRLATLFAVLFSLVNISIFAVLFFVISNNIDDYVKEHVDEVRSALAAVGESGGRDALIGMVGRQVAGAQLEEDIYLLTDENGNYLAGNIAAIPRFEGWGTIAWATLPLRERWSGPRKSTAVIGHWTQVKNGYLLVADGNGDVTQAQEILFKGLLWGVGLAAISAILGGFLVGLGVQRRVSLMESALGDFASGQLTARIPRDASGDDLDHIAALINTTLDRLQSLIGEIKQVTTDIAHDLKTPISRIRQKLETVLAANSEAQDGQSAIADALSDIDGVVETFDALLRIAEIEAGARRAKFVDLDLNTMLGGITETIQPVAHDHGHELQDFTPSQNQAIVRGDKQLLSQLFINLLENSIRHCPPGSRIQITLSAGEHEAVVRVTDNGPGIPAAERGKVFRRLYRVEKSRTTPGTGLGLSLVEAIAALHDAKVELVDNAPGLSVTLTFNLAEAPSSRSIL